MSLVSSLSQRYDLKVTKTCESCFGEILVLISYDDQDFTLSCPSCCTDYGDWSLVCDSKGNLHVVIDRHEDSFFFDSEVESISLFNSVWVVVDEFSPSGRVFVEKDDAIAYYHSRLSSIDFITLEEVPSYFLWEGPFLVSIHQGIFLGKKVLGYGKLIVN